jgi:hypothetical protein
MHFGIEKESQITPFRFLKDVLQTGRMDATCILQLSSHNFIDWLLDAGILLVEEDRFYSSYVQVGGAG